MPIWLIAFVIAALVGSLAEYWGHRLMHVWLLRKKHAAHHQDGVGQGWLWEFFDYVVGACFLLPLGFLHSAPAGLGWLAGGLAFACFAAYAHQLQHETPELCFWLVRPVHHLHHKEHMWKHNFGISLDIWDRVFGTYRHASWPPDPAQEKSWRRLFLIKWL